MRHSRLMVAGTAAALAAAVLGLGGVLAESPGGTSARAAAAIVRSDPSARTRASVRVLQARARSHPRDAEALAQLGLAYEQRARETGDPAYLVKADGVLRRSLRLRPRGTLALTGRGSLALSRHRFRRALVLGRRALETAPRDPAARAVVGDALVELGRYEQAFRAFDRLAAEDPGAAAYARISYGRELLGHTAPAIDAMKLAVAASGGNPEALAWTRVQLAKLELGRGRIERAETQLRLALGAFPRYPAALDGLAYVQAARGRLRSASELARQAVGAAPSPQFAATLADVYELAGDVRRAREQRALVDALARLLRANGVRADLEIALFDADRGRRPERAVALARRAYAEAPSVEAADVLGWTLARAGRCGEALRFSKRALRLGGRDAAKQFHRGMIERCLGRPDVARRWFRAALARNPYFSLRWAPVAREYLR